MTVTAMPGNRPGEPIFIVGIGIVGPALIQIAEGTCLRLDEKRWTMRAGDDTTQVLADTVAQRLIAIGLVAVHPDKVMERDLLVLTQAGREEAERYAWRRAMEIAEQIEPRPLLGPTGAELHRTARGVAFDLVRRMVEWSSWEQRQAETPSAFVELDGQPPLVLSDWIAAPGDPWDVRRRRLFHVLDMVAEAAMSGLSRSEMDDMARYGSLIAAEAFARAPQKDWAFGEAEVDEGGEG